MLCREVEERAPPVTPPPSAASTASMARRPVGAYMMSRAPASHAAEDAQLLASLWSPAAPSSPATRPGAASASPIEARRPRAGPAARSVLLALPVVLRAPQLLRRHLHPVTTSAQTVLLKPDVEVNPVDPDVDVVATSRDRRNAWYSSSQTAVSREIVAGSVLQQRRPPPGNRPSADTARSTAVWRYSSHRHRRLSHPRRPRPRPASVRGLAVPHHQPPPVCIAHLREPRCTPSPRPPGPLRHPPPSRPRVPSADVPRPVSPAAADPLISRRSWARRRRVFVPVVGYRRIPCRQGVLRC